MERESKLKWSKTKILHIIVSILVACAVWLYVDSYENPQGSETTKVISDIPIEFVGEDTTLADRGLMLLSSSDETITIEVRARRRIIAKLNPDKIRVQVDLKEITTTGTHSVSTRIIYPSGYKITSGEFSQNISVVNNSAYSVTLEIGELYSRNVDIRCALEGNVAEGYIAGELQFEPGTLEIRGPQELVDQVAYAKVTMKVDNATSSVTQTLDYQLYDKDDNLIEETRELRATSDKIQVTLPVNVEKELSLQMNFIEAPGASAKNLIYTITPASITVSGAAEQLNGVRSLTLDDFELENFSTPTTYNYVIPIPEGCENLSGTTRATLTIRYRDMTTSLVDATNFVCENVPEGKTVTILTTQLPVIVRGTTADVATVTSENVTVIADLTDVSDASGSYTVPAKVQIDSDGDVGVRGTYQVRVTISEKPDEEDPVPNPDPDPEAGSGSGSAASSGSASSGQP